MPRLPKRSKPGTHAATGSVRRTVPSSTSCMIAVVVATTLVSEARSKTVSSDIGSDSGTTARRPKAFS